MSYAVEPPRLAPYLTFAEAARLMRQNEAMRSAANRLRCRVWFLRGAVLGLLTGWACLYGVLGAHWLADNGHDAAIAQTITAAAHGLAEGLRQGIGAIAGGGERR